MPASATWNIGGRKPWSKRNLRSAKFNSLVTLPGGRAIITGGMAAFVVYLYLYRRAAGRPRMLRASHQTIANDTGLSKSAVQAALRLLVRRKLIEQGLDFMTRRMVVEKTFSPTGIVYKAAQTLAGQRINITDLNTKILHRSGKSLYVMLLEVQIPSRAKAAALRRRLEHLGRSLRLDSTLHEMDAVSL